MKATVSAASLKSAVSWVSKIVHSRATLPILDCLLLSAEDGKITVRATDLSVSLARTVEATVTEPGQVCVNAKSLKDYLSKAGKKNATLTIESKPVLLVMLEASGITVTLPDGNPKEFPQGLSNTIWADSFEFDPKAVDLKQIAKFADRDQDNNRVVLKCVLAEVSSGSYKLTTADGFRLVSTNAIPLDVHPIASDNASYLLLAKAAEMIASLKVKGTLRFGTDYAEFSTDDSTVTSRLDDGKFPDYSQIIPASDRGTWATFDTQTLAEKLESLAAVADKHTYLTRLELSNGKAMLSANDSDGNVGMTEMPVDWQDEEGFAIAFNAKYMLDCLVLCGEQTRIMFQADTPNIYRTDGSVSRTGSGKPMLIEGSGCLMVVMPMHIKR